MGTPDLATLLRLRQLYNPSAIAQATQPNVANSNTEMNPNTKTMTQDLSMPEDDAYSKLKQVLDQQPQRENYKPSGLRRFGAIMAGIGTGLHSKNPGVGIQTAEGIEAQPFNRAYSDWQKQVQPLQQEVGLENQQTLAGIKQEAEEARAKAENLTAQARVTQSQKQSASAQTMQYVTQNWDKGTNLKDNPDLLEAIKPHLTFEHQQQLEQMKIDSAMDRQESKNQNSQTLQTNKQDFTKNVINPEQEKQIGLRGAAQVGVVQERGAQDRQTKVAPSNVDTRPAKPTSQAIKQATDIAHGQMYNKYGKTNPELFDTIQGKDVKGNVVTNYRLKQTAPAIYQNELKGMVDKATGGSKTQAQSPLEDRIGKLLDERGL